MTTQNYQPRETAQMLSRDEAAMLLFAETGMSAGEVELCGGEKVRESLVALGCLIFNTQRDIWHLTYKGAFIANELCPNPKCQIVLALVNPITSFPEITIKNDMRVIWRGKCPSCGYTLDCDERDPSRFVMMLMNEQRAK